MKKKGFTLIELLAVIVILAIIALIATPIVMNVIENSKKGAAERSAANYLRAVETALAEERLDGPITDGTYIIQTDGSLCLSTGCADDTKIRVEVSGTIPSGGTIVIKNSITVKDESNMIIGEYTVVYNVTTNAPSVSTKTCILVSDFNGDGLGFGDEYLCDPGDGELRTFYVVEDGDTTTLTKTNGAQHSAAKKYGTTGKREVSLLAKKSVGSRTTFSNALTVLNTQTSDWTDVEVKLPTYHQIKIANGNKENKYPEWLASVESAFWTSTESDVSNLKNYFYVIGNLYFELYEKTGTFYSYVVPVITISKDQLG